MKKSQKYTLIFLVILLLFLSFQFNRLPSALANNELYTQINRFIEVFKIIKHYYVEEVNADKLVTGAINGMLEELDPHSIYIESERLGKVTEEFDGYFLGIGIEFIIQNNVLTVVAPIAGTPSERLGIRPGDKIIKINDKYTYGITEEKIKELLRGPYGSRVKVSIKRPNIKESFNLTIARDRIPIYSVVANFMLDDITGYVSLGRFSKTTSAELDESLTKLSRLGMKQLLLDLRSNSGGYLDQAVAVVDRFLDGGKTIVTTRGRLNGTQECFKSSESTPFKNLPLIILVNNGSASASEIVAGAIQDWDRGLIVGEKSFGKGLVQSQIKLHDQSAIRITIARYYTPTGRLIQRPYKNGIAEYYLPTDDANPNHQQTAGKSETANVFLTNKGRKVYGEGGIQPDIIIKSGLISPFTSQLLSQRLFFEFGSEFASQHRYLASDFDYFSNKFRITPNILDKFAEFVGNNNIEIRVDEYEKDLDYIRLLIHSEIARNFWDSKKYYEVYIRGDYQVQESRKLFFKSKQLAGLLKNKRGN